jgi:outer membrane immunogenic protein
MYRHETSRRQHDSHLKTPEPQEMTRTIVAAASAVLLGLISDAALADGTQARGGLYAPRCASFQGFYVGANVGSAFHDHTWSDRDAWAKHEVDLALPSSASGTESGWLAGVQGGYNWQKGCTVFGFEADWSWTNVEWGSFNTDGQPGAALDRLIVTSDIHSFGTIRTRAGVVVDSLMLYATGGVGWARMNSSWTVINNIGGAFVSETLGASDTRWGWAAGVGTEWAITSNISLKSEALYLKFDDHDSAANSGFAVLNGSPPSKRFEEQDALWVARIGLNFRFGRDRDVVPLK